MDDAKLREVLRDIERWEGCVAHLYLDHRGNPTIGLGCLIGDSVSFEVLPLMCSVGGVVRRATTDEKRAEFARVRAMDFSERLPARYYRALPPAPILYLEDADIDELAFRRLHVALAGLRRLCPGFDGFPAPAQSCLMDLAWNLGVGRQARDGAKATGLSAFRKLLAACNREDWRAAADECAVSSSRPARNAWRREMFIRAADAPTG